MLVELFIQHVLAGGTDSFASFYAANEGIFLDCLDEVIALIS